MNGQSQQIYEFGDFRLNKPERLLTRSGEPLALTPKAFDLLVLLVERHGSLLTKDELMNAVWTDSFVEEANLNVNISTLRKVLGESSFIETVPKKGYRFAADVSEIDAEPDIIIANYTKTRIIKEEAETSEREPQILPARQTRNNRNLIFTLLIGSLAVLLVGAFFYFGQINSPNQIAPSAEVVDLHRRGREAMERRNAEDIKRAIHFFELAIEKDENFALAHAGLSDAYSYLIDYDVLPPEEIHRKSKAEARRALELDDTLGKSHLSLGNMLRDEWDFAESVKQIKRAIELEPDNAEAHHIYSHLLLD